ncbi:polysaccharide deacetylase [Malaciobacter pacificus]|uniref:Polysaccharide deacetylase n=1 Tax=Malaciobacter pacificus TaxID=1080223 RepID=A0A5C2HAN8_9BACT|nr:polysaccharide deacetylase family protein [Malaciobacter pacificus]QEP34246.1 polysaccharide deacetylase [Malaciobacter pacificus]GGD39984.1 polysaccharide deacetylase [Malaciobacter pacificus]
MKSLFIPLFLISYIFANEDYEYIKNSIEMKYKNQTPKQWGENVTGVKSKLNTNEKSIVLTMDACGSKKGMGYDKEIIDFLIKEKIPAVLFINARWIDNNLSTFKSLASNPLFEIANHGFKHKPASVTGKEIYKIKGTENISELVDEIELNSQKIEQITNKRPKYFRSGTAYYDEIAVQIANDLNYEVIGYSILGDAGATFNETQVEKSISKSKSGDIILIHFNHPKSGTKNGLIKAVKKLKKDGYKFVSLSDYSLK